MLNLINHLHTVLNRLKGFGAGYSSESAPDGYIVIEYNGKRYAGKFTEIENPSKDSVTDVKNVRYMV